MVRVFTGSTMRALLMFVCCRGRQCGLSLVESLMVTLAAAVLLALAAPGFSALIDNQRLKAATNTLYSKLYAAKSEAIKRNSRIRVTFKVDADGTAWCYGFKINDACDCRAPGSCQIDGQEKTVHGKDFPGVHIGLHISSPGDRFTFDGSQWTMHGTFGHIRLMSPSGKQTRVIVSRVGRVRTCSPSGSGNVPGYSTSC